MRNFGHVWIFGYVWTRLDTFGYVWTRLDTILDTREHFGYGFGFWILPEENKEIMFWTRLDTPRRKPSGESKIINWRLLGTRPEIISVGGAAPRTPRSAGLLACDKLIVNSL